MDKLIEEGLERHKELKVQANKQIEMMQEDNAFDFNLESVDMFKF